MWVSDVELRDFRNHEHTHITLAPGITVFVGPNGQGKTNFVEALGYLAQLSSHRVSSDKALVRNGEKVATVRARVHHESRSVELACEIKAAGSNRGKLNGQAVSLGELAGWLKVVLFTPEDLAIIRGEPGGRRRYLDEAAIALKPRMLRTIAEYDRVVRQRNTLLKSARGRITPTIEASLSSWDDRLVDLAATITTERRALIANLTPYVSAAYHKVSGGDVVELRLDSPVATVSDSDLHQAYREALTTRRADELDRGMTLVGPHRDDLDVQLNAMPSRSHSSHGEAWSLAIALKMGLAEVYRADSLSGDPVIILDDVFAELDAKRRRLLQEVVASYEQVLVTAAVSEDIPQGFATQQFGVMAGEVSISE